MTKMEESLSTKEFNELARKALDQDNKYRIQVFPFFHQVRLYENNTKLVYQFDLSLKTISYEETVDNRLERSVFLMDKPTKKKIRKMIFDASKTDIRHVAFGTIVLVMFFVAIHSHKNQQIDKQVQEYKKTLPCWDDSIRLAKTNAELQHALDRREQQRLQLEYFRDSISGKNNR